MFNNIRIEREDIYHYFHTLRVNFEDFLRRPDTKQEFLAAWQAEYNEVAEDMRDDEETKAEMHQRVMVSEQIQVYKCVWCSLEIIVMSFVLSVMEYRIFLSISAHAPITAHQCHFQFKICGTINCPLKSSHPVASDYVPS